MACSHRVPIWCAALLSLAAASPAWAQMADEPDDAAQDDDAAAEGSLAASLSGEALVDYRAGHIAFRDGDFAGALLKFTSAYQVSGHPGLLWNMAACEKSLRNYAAVMKLVRRYKIEAASLMSEQRRQRADRLLVAVAQYVGELTIEVSTPDARVYVDGELVGRSPLAEPVLVSHGDRQLTVEKDGYKQHSQRLRVEGGKPLTVALTLIEEAPDPVVRGGPALTEPGPALRDSDDEGGISAWVWITGGLVLAGAGLAGYLLLRDDEPAPPEPGTLPPQVIELPLNR